MAESARRTRSAGAKGSGRGARAPKGASGRSAKRRRAAREAEADAADEGDGEDEQRSGRRALPAHKRPAPTFLWIILGVVGLGVIVSFFHMVSTRSEKPEVVQHFDQDTLREVERLKRQGEAHWRLAMTGDIGEAEQADAVAEARRNLEEAADLFEELMARYRDEDGEIPERYQGHTRVRQEIQQLLHDISRTARARR